MQLSAILLATATAVWGEPHSSDTRPDLVLVTIDTLRADALGVAVDGRSSTPQLDRLANEGRRFPNAHAHSVVTLPSHANILTGLYPFQHGVRENSGFRLAPAFPTLATILSTAGYATAAFVGGYPLESRFGLASGFEVYDDRFSSAQRDDEFAMAERRGDHVVTPALAWWRSAADRPRFLWIHLYDPHAPYAPPEPYASDFRDRPYQGEVAAVDAFLAPLLAELRTAAQREIFVALTADHGEALGDHGELTHGLFCYESTLRVPLILWGSRVTPLIDLRAARHIDLYPTVLEVAGLAPAGLVGSARFGRSLLATPPEEPIDSYFEALSATLNRGWAPLRGVLRGDRKAIELPLPELYDLAADPLETANRVDDERRAFRELLALLPTESKWPPDRGAVADEERRRLAALGYLSSSAPMVSSFGTADDPKRLLELDRKIFATIEAYSSGRADDAVALAREIVAARPTMPLGRSLLAQALLEAGRQDEALAEMRRARDDGVTTETLLRQLGLTLAERGETEAALAAVASLVAAGDLDARLVRAQALADAGRLAPAEAEVQQVLAARPDDPRALELVSLVELRRGRPEAARAAAAQAVELAPGQARAWNNLGVALFQLGRPSAALDAWQRAVDNDPRLWDALWNLGVQSAKLGRVEPARRALAAFARGAPLARFAADREEASRLLAALPAVPP